MTNASTTGLLDVRPADLGRGPHRRARAARRRCCPPLRAPGEVARPAPRRGRAETGLPTRRCSTLVGSHDTASAVVGGAGRRPTVRLHLLRHLVPRRASSSTRPVLTEESRLANFTNEGGVDGSDPLPAQRDGPVAAAGVAADVGAGRASRPTCRTLLDRGRRARRGGPVIDPDDPAFLPPGRHAGPDRRACRAAAGSSRRRPRRRVVRCILDSLAAAYAPSRPRRRPAVRPRRRRRPPRRRRSPQRAAVPADRRRLRAAGRGRPGRGHRARQRPRPGARPRAHRRRSRARCAPSSWRRRTVAPLRAAAPDRAGRRLTRCGSPCSSPASTTRCSRRSARRSSAPRVAWVTRSSSRRRRPAADRCTSTPATATACIPLVDGFTAAFAGYDAVVTPSAVVRRDGPPPSRDGGRLGGGDPGAPGPRGAGGRRDPAGLRADRVPGRRPGRDRRRRPLPAHGDVPSDLPLASACSGSATARSGCCAAVDGARPRRAARAPTSAAGSAARSP